MSSLYPGFGSGGALASLDLTLAAHSFASSGLDPALDRGDRVILPASAFKELSRLRLPFPIYFGVWPTKGAKARRARLKKAQQGVRRKAGRLRGGEVLEEVLTEPGQYCSVLEFSAPEGVVQMPQWVMDNLGVRHGGRVHLMSAAFLPKATFARLQPFEAAFSDLLARLGPKFFLEAALRRYSVLSRGERIMVEHDGRQHFVRVLEVRPDSKARTVSLLGSVDLEVDFAPALDDAEGVAEWERAKRAEDDGEKEMPAVEGAEKKTRKKKKTKTTAPPDPTTDDVGLQQALERSLAVSEAAPPERRQHLAVDEVVDCVADASYIWGEGAVTDDEGGEEEPAPDSSFSWGGEEDSKGPAAAAAAVVAVAAEEPAVAAAPLENQCSNCLRIVPASALTMHTMHCTRQYSRCGECGEVVRRANMAAHEAGHRPARCEACGEEVAAGDMDEHVAKRCLRAEVQCDFCRVVFVREALIEHEGACGRRTDQCDACGQWVKLRDMALHEDSACALPEPAVSRERADERALRDDVERRIDALDDELVERVKAVSEVTAFEGRERVGWAEGCDDAGGDGDGDGDGEDEEPLPCPHCRVLCPGFEPLQVHVLTSCKLAASSLAKERRAKKRRSKVGLGGRRRPAAGREGSPPPAAGSALNAVRRKRQSSASAASKKKGKGGEDLALAPNALAGSPAKALRRRRAAK